MLTKGDNNRVFEDHKQLHDIESHLFCLYYEEDEDHKSHSPQQLHVRQKKTFNARAKKREAAKSSEIQRKLLTISYQQRLLLGCCVSVRNVTLPNDSKSSDLIGSQIRGFFSHIGGTGTLDCLLNSAV